MPQSGTLALNGFGTSAAATARLAALQALDASGGDAALVSALGADQAHALAAATQLAPVLSGTSPLATYFTPATGSPSALSQQLLQVARLVQAATTGAVTAPSRQVFLVAQQGYDTHTGQLGRQAPLFADLSASLAGFHAAMTSLGLQDQVVSFTLSDFGRTLKPASGDGSDHAWGSHHLVVGGANAIRSGAYGTLPDLTLGGASDVSNEGRWLPTTSVDQYVATLGRWMGLAPAELGAALPNLANFPVADLGFLA